MLVSKQRVNQPPNIWYISFKWTQWTRKKQSNIFFDTVPACRNERVNMQTGTPAMFFITFIYKCGCDFHLVPNSSITAYIMVDIVNGIVWLYVNSATKVYVILPK